MAEKYPKFKYHATEQPVIVNSEEEEEQLGEDWADTPAAFLTDEATLASTPVEKMSKVELIAYAKEKFDVDLDKTKKIADLRAEVEAHSKA